MAVEVELTPIVSGYNVTKINTNFENIEAGLQDALSRSGASPNAMGADIDMDGNDVLNAGIISAEHVLLNGEEIVVDELLAQGPPGEDGEDGANASVTVGTTTTGAAGTDASVVNVGTAQDAILNFTIPRGNTGASGAGTGDMLAAQNLADVDNAATAFANIKQAASLTATGVAELATDAEALAKSDTARVMTPSNLAALGASETFAGLVELSTIAESVTGTDTARAVTPAGLAAAIAAITAAVLPVGTVLPYAGTTAPSGFVFPYGQTYLRSNTAVWDVLGTTYGVGDGVTTANYPDLRGRAPIGKDNMGGSAANRLTNTADTGHGIIGSTLGSAGGADVHTLLTAELPAHSHDLATGVRRGANGDGSPSGWDGGDTAIFSSVSKTTTSTGTGDDHNNMQPSIVLNYIMYIGS